MTKEQKMALVVATSTAFTTAFAGSALNLAIPAMGTYFHMGASSVGWITTAYMLMIAATAVPFGKIADSTSRRDMLIAGVAVFGVCSVLAVLMRSAAGILTVRAIQGAGAAMIFASNMPIAISAFPGKERGRAIGIVISGVYTGLALGPALGGFLNSMFSWKAIFIFGAVIAFSSMALTFIGVPKDRQKKEGKGFDLAGNITYILMIAAVIYGLTALNSIRFGWMFLVCGVFLGVLFTLIELRSANPVIDVRIFAEDKVFTLSNLTALFNYSSTFALGYLLSIYLQVAQGMTSRAAGIILISQPVVMAVLSPKMGKLSDKIPAYKLASAGMAFCAASLLFFAFAQVNTPVWAVCVALGFAGLGTAFFSSPNTNVVMSCVPPSKYAVANSILSTMRTTGQSTGMAIITLVVSAIVGNVSLYDVPAADLIHTMHIGFLIFTALSVLGIIMSMQRRKS